MKNRFAAVVAGVVGAGALVAACNLENPTANCQVGHGDYAAKYILVTGTGSCAELKGEAVGVNKFFPDAGANNIGILPAGANAGDDPTVALGPLENEMPTDTFCSVPTLTTSASTLPSERTPLLEDGGLDPDAGLDFDAGTVVFEDDAGFLETAAARPISYAFADTRFYVTASAPGLQFESTLTYTDSSENCSATYKVVAMFPAVDCRVTDEDGDPIPNPDGGMFIADDTLCDPRADYASGRFEGSGINPDFDTSCDAETGLCQLKSDTIGHESLKAHEH